MACEHKDFTACVKVCRMEDTSQFNAEVKIFCVDCHEPFRFLGLKSGLDLRGAMCSPDGLEARLAVVPKNDKTPGDHALRGFGIGDAMDLKLCECGAPESAHGGCRNFRPVRKGG